MAYAFNNDKSKITTPKFYHKKLTFDPNDQYTPNMDAISLFEVGIVNDYEKVHVLAIKLHIIGEDAWVSENDRTVIENVIFAIKDNAITFVLNSSSSKVIKGSVLIGIF